jgi:hypothetical protein
MKWGTSSPIFQKEKTVTNFRVMKTNEFEDAVYYRVACSCGSDDHDLTIEFERDPELPDMLFLNFYKDLAWSSYWGDSNFFNRIWKRFKASLRIFFVGYIEVEESFIIQGEEHIDSFIKALEEGKQFIKK